MNSSSSLPCPQFTIAIELPLDQQAPIDCSALPTRPGVFAIEDEAGQTLALAATSNLRRAALAKLQPPAEDSRPTKRVNFRPVARQVRALRVGSAFEADWAWLQHARMRLPLTYRALLDRWQAWFVQCDPAAEFPQFIKLAHPRIEPESSHVHLGPFPEKHAAGRYIEMLEDAFDLCRYHHILVQSPHGMACAYKEMGRCPAPCDGSVSMDHYRSQVRAAIEFAETPVPQWRSEEEAAMRRASESLDFEAAQRHRQRLDRTAIATRAEFAHVNRLERFKVVAVMPGETRTYARVFVIRGGWIEIAGDVKVDCEIDELSAVMANIRMLAKPQDAAGGGQTADFSDAAIENIGLVCWHMFRPRNAKQRGTFHRFSDVFSVDCLLKAVRSLSKSVAADAEDEAAIIEHDAEILADRDQKTADERG